MRHAADACTGFRIALAPMFAWAVLEAHAEPSVLPLVVYVLAAFTDLADGWLARAAGSAGPRGRLLDHGADAIFLFPTMIILALLGRMPLALPCAAMVAFALYALDGWRRGVGPRTLDLLPRRLGAMGGVLNYVVTGLAALALALGPTALDALVYIAALVIAVANLLAAGERVPGMLRRARPASGSP